MTSTRQGFSPHAAKRWMPVALIAGVAVLAGILLPQSLPSAAPAIPAAAPNEPAGKNALAYSPPVLPEAPDARSMLTRLAVGTAVVLCLCVATLLLGRRWLTAGAAGTPAATHLRLVETMSLGNRCWVHLLHLGEHSLLVGTDSAGVKVIVPLPETFEQKLGAISVDAEAAGPSLP